MAVAATERQQEVLDLIGQNKTVAEMAKALGLTENGVRSHIKRLKQRGLVSKSYGSRGGSRSRSRRRSANGRGGQAAANPQTTVRSSNGSSGAFKLDGIPAIELASKQIGARQGEIAEEAASIAEREAELSAELTVLADRAKALTEENNRLTKVDKALAGAVA